MTLPVSSFLYLKSKRSAELTFSFSVLTFLMQKITISFFVAVTLVADASCLECDYKANTRINCQNGVVSYFFLSFVIAFFSIRDT